MNTSGGNTRAMTAFLPTPWFVSILRTDRFTGGWGEYVRRFKGPLGKAEGIVAWAHT